MRGALAAWVLLLALAPFLHKPLVHPALDHDLALAICVAEGHPIPAMPQHGEDESCPVFGLLQVFGTQLAPQPAMPPVPVRQTVATVDPARSDRPLSLRQDYRPLQPRAPPFV